MMKLMNVCNNEDKKWCNFHPTELVIGVCAFCLNERLLVLASKQEHTKRTNSVTSRKALTKIFALTSLLNRSDIKNYKPQEVYYSSSTSQEDSFISIKFEDNGIASWDKGEISKMSLDQQCELSWRDRWDKVKKINSVVEHIKPRTTLRWQRRIGHLFQLSRWKRSNKGNMCHMGAKLEGTKGKYGWIKTMTTKRRNKD